MDLFCFLGLISLRGHCYRTGHRVNIQGTLLVLVQCIQMGCEKAEHSKSLDTKYAMMVSLPHLVEAGAGEGDGVPVRHGGCVEGEGGGHRVEGVQPHHLQRRQCGGNNSNNRCLSEPLCWLSQSLSKCLQHSVYQSKS